MRAIIYAAPFMALLSTAAYAQDAMPVQSAPVQAQAVSAQPEYSIPANTEITLRMNEELHTQRNDEGDTFNLSVVHDVRLGDYIVIPAGTRAVGEITWMTGRGMFGKSGKMDIQMRYIDLNGRRIPVEGEFRQEGEGNTVATVAGVVLIPVAGLFITGRSGVIPEGRELTAHLSQALPVALPAGAVVRQGGAVRAIPASAPVAMPATEASPIPASIESPSPVFPGAVVPDGLEGTDE